MTDFEEYLRQIADASGLHQTVDRRIEQGVANPAVHTPGAVVRALDARLTLMDRRG